MLNEWNCFVTNWRLLFKFSDSSLDADELIAGLSCKITAAAAEKLITIITSVEKENFLIFFCEGQISSWWKNVKG